MPGGGRAADWWPGAVSARVDQGCLHGLHPWQAAGSRAALRAPVRTRGLSAAGAEGRNGASAAPAHAARALRRRCRDGRRAFHVPRSGSRGRGAATAARGKAGVAVLTVVSVLTAPVGVLTGP